jgi:hypothetical protein
MQYANKQTAVSEQRLGKHVPAETNTHATVVERCFRCGPHRGVILTIKLTSSVVNSQLRVGSSVQFCKGG